MAKVELQNIRKSFEGHEVLHNINALIEDGNFTALVGPSGCGKSTLLRLLAGLDRPTGGKIRIDDAVVNFMPPKKRDIAMVFQSYALYPHMSVAENMGFSLKLKGVSKRDIRTRVMQAADMLDLTPLLERRPAELSGGQRQRVAMGRAVVRKPKIFLFDEPLSNLDAKLRVQMRAEIKELHRKLSATIIYVTHDQIEAITMADQIVVLNEGYVEQIGAPLDVYDHPASVFVASFIGSPAMNLVRGRLTAGEAGAFVSELGMTLPTGPIAASFEGMPVICGFRPEHLDRAEQGLEAQVAVSEPMGSETLVFADVGEERITIFFRERVDVDYGDRLTLSVRPERLHFFDIDSGRNLHPSGDRIKMAV